MAKPKTYKRPVPATWFLKKRNYTLFMIRELTSVFVLIFVIELLLVLSHAADAATFADCMASLDTPLVKAWHGLVLLMALWHSFTWFNLTPKAMPMYLGEDKVPDRMVAIGMGYAPWAVITVIVVWYLASSGS